MRFLGVIFFALILVMILLGLRWVVEPRLREKREEELLALCESRLGRLAQALHRYIQDYDNLLPPPQKWCDALEFYVPPSQRPFVFHCPKRGEREGYGYAMNAYAWDERWNAPRWLPEMYPRERVVLLYETKQRGRNRSGRGDDISNPGRHDGKLIILFSDFTTMVLTTDDVQEMRERGEILFKPLPLPRRLLTPRP